MLFNCATDIDTVLPFREVSILINLLLSFVVNISCDGNKLLFQDLLIIILCHKHYVMSQRYFIIEHIILCYERWDVMKITAVSLHIYHILCRQHNMLSHTHIIVVNSINLLHITLCHLHVIYA